MHKSAPDLSWLGDGTSTVVAPVVSQLSRNHISMSQLELTEFVRLSSSFPPF